MLKAQTEDFKSSDNIRDNENMAKQIPIKILHIADTYLHNRKFSHLLYLLIIPSPLGAFEIITS